MKKLVLLLFITVLMTSCSTAVPPTAEPALPDAPQSEPTVPVAETEPVAEASTTLPIPQEKPPAVTPPPSTTSSTTTQTWWQEGLSEKYFSYDFTGELACYGSGDSYFYLYDDRTKISYPVWDCFTTENSDSSFSLILNTATESDDIGEKIMDDYFFELVALDDTKYTGEFYEHGILLTRSLPQMMKGEQVMLAIDSTDYEKLLENVQTELEDAYGSMAWLSMMRRTRMVSASITDYNGEKIAQFDFLNPPAENADLSYQHEYFYEDINFNVKSTCEFTDKKSLPDSSVVEIKFNHGVVFRIFYGVKNILVTSSDMDFSILYTPDEGIPREDIVSFIVDKGNNEYTGKPVIYLYPTKPLDCHVTVDYPSFTYTYPTYQNGWDVTAYPDGRLINKADNSEHYYLFWEGNKKISWDFARGFVVKGCDTEKFLREKLPYMGLTPREYNDFITYWVPRMQDAPYNLITFASKQYEELAPLTITPQPDSILRIHMVYKALDAPVDIPEQTLHPFARKGFTAVEWGGTHTA